MTDDKLGRVAVCVGVGVALLAPLSQSLLGWGLTASEFSSQGDSTLRVAGYAFSIWGVIYALLIAYAVRAALGARPDLRRLTDWPVAAASLGCGVWIICAGLNLRWLTVAVIVAALVAALLGLFSLSRAGLTLGLKDRLTLLLPISLLAGWLTVASVVNLLTVLTAEQLIGGGQASTLAIAGVATAGLMAIAVLLATRVASYVAPVAWGLVGVWVAEAAGKPTVGVAALIGAGVLIMAAVLLSLRKA